MDELEVLRRENARLDAEEEIRKNYAKKEREKRSLKRQIWVKKNPKTVRVVKVAKQSIGGVGMIFGSVGRAVAPSIKKGAMNFAENSRRTVAPKKRVVRVKRSKPKKRRIKRVVERNPFGFPF